MWIEKEDTGTQSAAEQEKGLASDSFKRACFNLGIGRELYDYPVISIKLASANNCIFLGITRLSSCVMTNIFMSLFIVKIYF